MTHAILSDPRVLRRGVIAMVCGLLAVQVLAAARLELMFDEAYYRLWAEHLAWGYYDHPPLVALWIRLSMLVFGDTEFGARALGVLATGLGAAAVFAIARDLFPRDAMTPLIAAAFWCLTPLIQVGAILATPDTPLMVGWTTAVWALARLYRTGQWGWWIVVGGAAGVALEAKYTALFLGPGIVAALLVLPSWRHWWRHPAPYSGGVVAGLLFAPNIAWNAAHGWQTFVKQFGRAGETEWTLRFVGEFIGGQFGLMNPALAILAGYGVVGAVRGADAERRAASRLLVCLVAPLLLFFLSHSLHDRVQPNWMAPAYPALIVLAAAATVAGLGDARRARATQMTALVAAPIGVAAIAVVYLQALVTPLPLKPQADPTSLFAGWRGLASDLDALAAREGAALVLTQSYALTSLLRVYGPAARPVIQYNERARWPDDPATGPLAGPAPTLFVVEARRAGPGAPLDRFAERREIARIDRTRRGTVLESYIVYRAERPIKPVLDPVRYGGR